jgi:hypothetical protein
VDEARSFGLAGKVYALSNGELVLEDEELSWYHVVPIVNIFYDFFADAPPSPETLKEILNIFGLVSALLLSVAGGFPGSTSFQEIQDALERFSGYKDVSWSYCVKSSTNSDSTLFDQKNGNRCREILKNGGTNNYVDSNVAPQWYINALGNYINATIGPLTMSLVGVLLVYMFMANTSFIGPKKTLKIDGQVD